MNALLEIADVSVRQTQNGLYCLNDLHKAAGDDKKYQPNNWLRNELTIQLIDEIKHSSDLRSGNGKSMDNYSDPSRYPIEVINGGPDRGTYVCELLVYNYAAWISPKFNLLVFETFQQVVHGEQVNKPSLDIEFEQALKTLEQICDSSGIKRKDNLHGYYQLAKDFGLERYFQPNLDAVHPKPEVIKAVGEQMHGPVWYVTLTLFLKELSHGKVNQSVYPWLVENDQFYIRTSTIINYLRSVPELYKQMLQFGINSDRVLKKELKKQNIIRRDSAEKTIANERCSNMVAMSISHLKSLGFPFLEVK